LRLRWSLVCLVFDRPDKDCCRGIVTGRHLFRWIRGLPILTNIQTRLSRRGSPVGFVGFWGSGFWTNIQPQDS